MLVLLITVLPFSLLYLSKTLALHPLPKWANESRLLSIFYQELILLLSFSLKGSAQIRSWVLSQISLIMYPRKKWGNKVASLEEPSELSILDLPDLALELILGKLPPSGLCTMSAVCAELRYKCKSDYLWERHMKEKWGRVVGPTAKREWELYLGSAKSCSVPASASSLGGKQKRWSVASSLSRVWPISWIKSKIDSGAKSTSVRLLDDSIMSWYVSLESGRFWFPAQVYNREHGHAGFMLSCYDADLSYDCQTDTFKARYPPHGRRAMVLEEGVEWERVRAPPVDTSAHDLHASDCLKDLRPGDHVEIQWRRNKEFPYGWWYGMVGHLESCDGDEHFCRCHLSDTVVLEFNQYTVGSRWRQASINRRDHREEGNETDGFYGGLRKLLSGDEMAKWRQLWPTDSLE